MRFFCFTAENLLKKLEECENFSQKWWKFLGRNPFRLSKDGRELFTGAEIKLFLDSKVIHIFFQNKIINKKYLSFLVTALGVTAASSLTSGEKLESASDAGACWLN